MVTGRRLLKAARMVKRVLIAFDFDHTLIDETIDTYVLRLLPPDHTDLPPAVSKLYSIHHWNEYQREVFRYLHSCRVTRDQLLACVAEMPMVEGMRQLLEYLTKYRLKTDGTVNGRETTSEAVMNGVATNGVIPTQQQQHAVTSGTTGTVSAAAGLHGSAVHDGKNASSSLEAPVQFDVIIVSDANSAIIEHILYVVGLRSMFSKVYTNPASFDNSGCLQLSPYHRQDWCTMSPANMCKGHILDEHCRKSSIKYDVVAFVGDGENDFCPTVRLRETDIVFPRRGFPLDKHIIEGRDKVAATVRPWETGYDILNAVKEDLMNVKA